MTSNTAKKQANLGFFEPSNDSNEEIAGGAALTPMMTQYMAIKRDVPDALLFYRMGDFYELFFEDAVKASQALTITLTKRGQLNGIDIPMCGVPVASHETYLIRLIRAGFRVAICEQTEDPAEAKKRGGKSVVRREVTRLITPGTLTEDNLLPAGANNYLLALTEAGSIVGLAWLDLSTGEFILQSIAVEQLPSVLARIRAGEILLPEKLAKKPELQDLWQEWRAALTIQPDSRFDSINGEKRLKALYQVSTLDAFGDFDRAEIAAAGALVDYIELTQKGKVPQLNAPRQLRNDEVMEIDAATRRNLELIVTLGGEKQGSLLDSIDYTLTNAGARLLVNRLSAPLRDVKAIQQRLDSVAYFQNSVRGPLREKLKNFSDLERCLSRMALGRGGPRDLQSIAQGLARAAEIKTLLLQNGIDKNLVELKESLDSIYDYSALVDRLTRALKPDVPLQARDGGFIEKNYAPQFDELVRLRDDSKQLIANLQLQYARKSGITALKIKHNNVIGYFLEVNPAQAERMLDPQFQGLFIHRQSMANAVRFTTVELSELERKILEAAGKALAVELELFDQLVNEVLIRKDDIIKTAKALATFDVSAALAELAADYNYVRPEIDDSAAFDIESGRHPVVEQILARRDGEKFVPNDCDLGTAQRLWLLTGPNMAGKSTFLRQNALITILAQMGSFVPASRAHIGVVDRLFSRVGAADDLARGRSTFMVEMVETASILNQATERSLVILDEIGRGTATFDGLSIAWACVEYLHDSNKCRALFATHYHELTTLASILKQLACYTMQVKEWEKQIIFLHSVAPGTADRSYGVHVAQLAGLPDSVTSRAEQILATLESQQATGSALNVPAVAPKTEARKDALRDELKQVNLDALSPKEALEVLYKLKVLN